MNNLAGHSTDFSLFTVLDKIRLYKRDMLENISENAKISWFLYNDKKKIVFCFYIWLLKGFECNI